MIYMQVQQVQLGTGSASHTDDSAKPSSNASFAFLAKLLFIHAASPLADIHNMLVVVL
jgi:hypothetical protein